MNESAVVCQQLEDDPFISVTNQAADAAALHCLLTVY